MFELFMFIIILFISIMIGFIVMFRYINKHMINEINKINEEAKRVMADDVYSAIELISFLKNNK